MKIFFHILSTGTDLTALPDSVYQTALQSLSLDNVSTRGMAEILQHFREGIYHPLIALNPEAETEERLAVGRKEDEQAHDLRVKVTPNPFNYEVSFDLSRLGEGIHSLIVTDLLGRIIWSKQMSGGQRFTWITTQVPDGQYFYHLRAEGGLVQNGKLVKANR